MCLVVFLVVGFLIFFGNDEKKKIAGEGREKVLNLVRLFFIQAETAATSAALSACSFPTRRSFTAVRRILAAAIAAPKPLSMLQTTTPGLEETSAESSGVIP